MVMSEEEWRPVKGAEGKYSVSSLGRVRSENRTILCKNVVFKQLKGRILEHTIGTGGYHRVALSGTKLLGSKTKLVHRLVTEMFLGECPNSLLVCHIDGDPNNNNINNLRYGTPASNSQDVIFHGNNFNANKTHCPSGHLYSKENVYLVPRLDGHQHRQCRACHRINHKTRSLSL